MCSLINVAHVVLCVVVLVGVGRVTVVHIGHEDVVVVKKFCVAIFVVICCIRRCTLYKQKLLAHQDFFLLQTENLALLRDQTVIVESRALTETAQRLKLHAHRQQQ